MSFLAALLGAEQVSLSVIPGRTGWVLTTAYDLQTLRCAGGRWLRRVVPIHADRGRFFVEPQAGYLLKSLNAGPVGLDEELYRCPMRVDRLRRLQSVLKGRTPDDRNAPAPTLFRLALRLEWSARRQLGVKFWKHTAGDFDRVWQKVALYARPLHPLEHRVLTLLCEKKGMNLDRSGQR